MDLFKKLVFFSISLLLFVPSILIASASLKIIAPQQEVLRQQNRYPTTISFDQAVLKAVELILHSTEHVESPRNLYQIEYWGEDQAFIIEKIQKDLQDGKTTLRLLAEQDPVEGQELVAENWIFRLDIPTFSDHIFWIVIHRKGKKPSYLYGFN